MQTKLSPTNRIGIIGCGHLGRTLAKTLIDRQFPRENLRISYNGNPATLESIQNAGLFKNIAENDQICNNSDIIFFCIKPQDFKALKPMNFSPHTIFISCIAGISTATFQHSLRINTIRIMPSGPDSILQGRGIVALFPHHDQAINILSYMGFKIYEIAREELLHPFTAVVCLPAALLLAKRLNLNVNKDINKLEAEYPGLDFKGIYHWAVDVMPNLESEGAEDDFIRKMMTKGGITEAIVESLRSDKNFLEAVHQGICRSKEIAENTYSLLDKS
jgi:pyrroline-5-carboxylate reductase